MATRSRQLNVPYFTQPTGNTCQSTVLKMFSAYVEREVLKEDAGAMSLEPTAIYKTVNSGSERPVALQNAHANFKWWLEKRFPTLTITYQSTPVVSEAIDLLVSAIDRGFPVLVSVSHARVPGHIVLVIGYEGYMDNATSTAFRLVVHDPFGAFDPTLLSDSYGKQRYERGACLQAGGETGPGTAVRLDPMAASRQRKGDKSFGTFYLMSARR